jgi:hypothetical protein
VDDVLLWTKVAGLATAIFTAIAAGLKICEKLSLSRREKEGKSALERGALAATTLHLVMDQLHGHRALFLRAHNGGGPLDPARRTYTSAEMEARDRTVPKRILDWKDRPIDAQYMNLMQRVATEEVVTLKTKNLPKESILRGVYEADGVVGSIVFRLWNTDTDFFFVSVALTDESELGQLSPVKQEAVRSAKATFRKLLRDKEVLRV